MKLLKSLFLIMSLAAANQVSGGTASVTLTEYGEFEGKSVTLYTLTNEQGMVAQITNFGGIVVSLLVPDREGLLEDVVLGYENFAAYEADGGWYGAITGRNANRIADGRFSLDRKAYQLSTNNGLSFLNSLNLGHAYRCLSGIFNSRRVP